MESEEMEKQLQDQKAAFDEQRKQIDMQEKMLGVGMGTHRVIKDMRKNKPKVEPYLPPSGKPNANKAKS
jgi:hypothetical protein